MVAHLYLVNRVKTTWNNLALLCVSWECLVTKIRNDLNPFKTHLKRPRQIHEIRRNKIALNYEMIVSRNVAMVFSITRGVLLSNVCHVGLAKVIHCGVI